MERGALIADRYELTRLLGRGGMGEVWAARDRRLHRGVAVKLLRHDDLASRELVRRFAREAVAAAQINHPNVVALHDSGVHEDVHFLVMEHIEGTSLAEHLHRQGPLPLARAATAFSAMAAAFLTPRLGRGRPVGGCRCHCARRERPARRRRSHRPSAVPRSAAAPEPVRGCGR